MCARQPVVDPPKHAVAALTAVGLAPPRRGVSRKAQSAARSSASRIARALAGRPSVILADEPTAALDAENGRAVMALLPEVAKDPNRAVLAVTHDHRTLPYADRIIRIEDGVISSECARNKTPSPAAAHDEHHHEPQSAPTPPQPQTTQPAGNEKPLRGRYRIRRNA